MKKVVILIDGQNQFYSLKNLGIQEREVNWGGFFRSLLSESDELIRTYWFRPQRILDTYFSYENIKNQVVYKQFKNYYSDFREDETRLPEPIRNSIDEHVASVENWIKEERAKFSQIEYNYDQISLEFDDIEIVKTGIVKVNP
ncbi:MAG: NYN domain-containing protein [Cytophagales bacterium]|nr:NYN domain-containing protein [Cytophagales bacterium]